MTIRLFTAALSDVGRMRPANEDAYAVDADAHLLAVADGMGGHQAGEVASATAIDALREGLRAGRSVGEAITDANATVFAKASGDPSLRGMGTTLTAAILAGDQTLSIGHVGDSRAYLLRGDTFRRLTVDHSVVAELIAAGQLTEAEAEVDPRRAMITRALGIDADVEVDVHAVSLEAGDRILLCSDGLTTMLRDDAIEATLRDEPDRERAVQQLVAAANAEGGADNITVIVADVEVDDTAAPSAPSAPSTPTDASTAVGLSTEALPAAPAPAAPPEPPDEEAPAAAVDVESADAAEAPATPRRRWWRRRGRE